MPGNIYQGGATYTFTGPGGTGKTRLSIEVGTQLLSNFANGVWLIELAPLSDESQIIPALAQTFGLQLLKANGQEQVKVFLGGIVPDEDVPLLCDLMALPVSATRRCAMFLTMRKSEASSSSRRNCSFCV